MRKVNRTRYGPILRTSEAKSLAVVCEGNPCFFCEGNPLHGGVRLRCPTQPAFFRGEVALGAEGGVIEPRPALA